MKTIRPHFIILTLAGLLSWSAGAAEPAKKPDVKKPSESAIRTTGLPIESWPFDEVEFNNMEMNEVVEYLRHAVKSTDANFILSEEIANVTVNLQLRNVQFDQLTRAVAIASEGRVEFESVDGSLYHIRPGEVQVHREKPVMRVFKLANYLQGKEEKEAAKAIEAVHQTAEMAYEMLNEA
jgi:hypothetical protein